MPVTTKQGDATSPRPAKGETVIIAHICNDVSAWGAGFVLAVSALSREPEMRYRHLAIAFGAGKDSDERIPRGLVQFVPIAVDGCDGNIIVANMIAQNGIDPSVVRGGCLVDYQSLGDCLSQVFEKAENVDAKIHMPEGIGSGLAGGDKSTIMDMIAVRATVAHVTLWEYLDAASPSYYKKAENHEEG